MLASPSFLALIVQPSASANISRTMLGTERPDWPTSRCLISHAFSAKRQASMNSGTWCSSHSLRTASRLARLTGWPPPALLVTVIMTRAVRSPSVARCAASRSRSTLPLNGESLVVSRLSMHGRSTALAPLDSTLARVVSKCVLLKTTMPGPARVLNSKCSAARPWCVGTTCSKPNVSRTASSKRS